MLRKKEWLVLLVVFALAAVCFFLPFERLESAHLDTVMVTNLSGFQLVGGDCEFDLPTGERVPAKRLVSEGGQSRTDYTHMFSMMLCAAMIGLGGALLDRTGRRKGWIGLIASAVGAGLSFFMIWRIPATYALGEKLAESVADYASHAVTAAAGIGLYVFAAISLVAFALSAVTLRLVPREAQAPVNHTKIITRIGVLGAIAAVLYYIPGIPVIPPIYKLDFSTVPVLLGGFSMGTVPALLILLIKDLIGLTNSSSMGVGELADFLVSAAMAITAIKIYQHHRTLKGALLGLITGIAAMVVVGALANYFIMIPFYVQVMNMPLETIIAMIGKVIPAVNSLMTLILLATAPFNLLKGVVLAILTFLLYKRLSPLLK